MFWVNSGNRARNSLLFSEKRSFVRSFGGMGVHDEKSRGTTLPMVATEHPKVCIEFQGISELEWVDIHGEKLTTSVVTLGPSINFINLERFIRRKFKIRASQKINLEYASAQKRSDVGARRANQHRAGETGRVHSVCDSLSTVYTVHHRRIGPSISLLVTSFSPSFYQGRTTADFALPDNLLSIPESEAKLKTGRMAPTILGFNCLVGRQGTNPRREVRRSVSTGSFGASPASSQKNQDESRKHMRRSTSLTCLTRIKD
eukprot:1345272-Amorphochlora_amoeboformis.AAC.2